MSEELNLNTSFVSEAEFPGTIDDIRVSFDFESPHYYDDETGTPVYNDSECETPHFDDEESALSMDMSIDKNTPIDVTDDKNTPEVRESPFTHEIIEKRGRRQVIPDAALAIALGGYSFESYADPVGRRSAFYYCLCNRTSLMS